MECELLQKLLPSEVHDYYIRNGIRADGRDLLTHRSLHVVRKVLANKTGGRDADQVSCSVKLG
jgi:exosome complex RNA-binding protein Rrp42 (RNase PH superfamily)